MKTHFEQSGTYPTPRLIGRLVRIAAGIVILWITFAPTLPHFEAFTRLREGWDVPPSGIRWIPGVLFSIYLLPHMIDRGFTLNSRGWSRLVFGGLALGVVVFDLAYYGSLWGPPLGWLILVTIWGVFGHLGLSFVVAGLVAAPG